MATSTALTHQTYFDGKVQSIGFSRNGRRATAGVIAPGEFHFGTEAPERMTIISGELAVKPDGQSAWSHYPAGTSFEIPGRNGFDVRAAEPCAYLCEFL
jgi:purine/pyrimidine-nucleoside phosphorylase